MTQAKARRTGEHTTSSVELADIACSPRLDFDIEEREIVRKLIRSHLEMSECLATDTSTRQRAPAQRKSRQPDAAQRCSR